MSSLAASKHDLPRLQALAAVEAALDRLRPSADAIFVREPLVDGHCPAAGDVDLLVFGPVDDLLPERIFPAPGQAAVPADLIWLPSIALDDPGAFAARGVLPHRLLSSRVVHDCEGRAAAQAASVARLMYAPEIQGRRIAGILDLGFLTVREMGITWDFPALALFWLHVAYAACLAALADATRTLCPNVYSRPFDYTRALEALSGLRLDAPFTAALRLGAAPTDLVPALRRLQLAVTRRFREPPWPAGAKRSTRYEYRYFGHPEELEFRVRAAIEMGRRGQAANGVFYLRFFAYALARMPSVHADSVRGETPAFLRPPRPVRPELEELFPEILPDLTLILGGRDPLAVAEVREALGRVTALRRDVLAFVKDRHIPVPSVREWIPFSGAPAGAPGVVMPPPTTEAEISKEE